MDIKDLVELAGTTSAAKGFHSLGRTFGDCIALIHSEASEALEAFREAGVEPWVGEKGKPEGVPSELADIVIRVADLAYEHGIDLDAEIEAKMAHNRTRPYLHGGKTL